jgi:diketogulonate reductase-like aldo/keto reductase
MIKRRTLLAAVGSLWIAPRAGLGAHHETAPIRRLIHSSAGGETLPVIGMGSSRTFDVAPERDMLAQLAEVMRIFLDGQGALIDSSPMYGNAETVLGQVLAMLDNAKPPFAATKVWTDGAQAGIRQMQESSRRMGVPVFDLMQIHNLRDWKVHLSTLRRWKEEGKIRYLGITTSHRRFHTELEAIMQREPLDFVQFSYNIENRKAEERLLPLAADRGIATIINRPYQRGDLFARTRDKPLPPLAAELGCRSWGQFFLKFIIGHPAVTCLIPATSKPHHMRDNMGANFGPVPDTAQREAMARIYRAL